MLERIRDRALTLVLMPLALALAAGCPPDRSDDDDSAVSDDDDSAPMDDDDNGDDDVAEDYGCRTDDGSAPHHPLLRGLRAA